MIGAFRSLALSLRKGNFGIAFTKKALQFGKVAGLTGIPNLRMMKSNKLVAIIIVAGMIGLIGCKPSETKITGQVFIVTQGAENVKLGAVEIVLIEKKQVVDYLRERKIDIDADIKNHKQELADALKSIETANVNEAEVSNQVERLVRAHPFGSSGLEVESGLVRAEASHYWVGLEMAFGLVQASPQPQFEGGTITEDAYTVANNFADQQNKKLKDAHEAVTSAELKADNLKEWLKHFPTTEDYLSGFQPVAIKKTLTDADGKFYITCPCDTGITLYAKAQRQVGYRAEHYYWLIGAPTHSESGPFILSNNNLIEIDPDNYVKIKPQKPE
ncbi:MAG: hypothetical protein ABSA83_20415 [Verrucomicrobiota bacterium]